MHDNIKPCWWGSHLWQTIYFMVAVYPTNPTSEQIDSMRCFFKALRNLLPCEGCQESYFKFSSEPHTNIDNLDNFKSKNSLIEFIYTLRNCVNSKVGHEYHINLNYFKKKLAYMIINENNNFDGKVCEMVEAPFIPIDLEKKTLNYLKSNTNFDSEYTKKLLEISKKFMENPVFDYNDKTFKFMFKRHKKCRKIICKINHRMSEGKYDLIQSFKEHDRNLHEQLLFYGCVMLHRENFLQITEQKSNSKKKY
jgi:hypothetical protein